jgi:peptide/nickel transport system substrate-binding protein
MRKEAMCRGHRHLWIFLIITTLWLTACNGGALSPTLTPTAIPTETPSPRGIGGTLRLLNWRTTTTLNPHLSTSTKDLEASRITYEPLASVDKDGNLAALPPTANQ